MQGSVLCMVIGIEQAECQLSASSKTGGWGESGSKKYQDGPTDRA